MVARVSWSFGVFATMFLGAGVANPDVETLVQRSLAATEFDWRAEPGYDHRERNNTGGAANTYQVTMIDGTPYKRLVAINDQLLPPSRERDEQRKLETVIAQRRSESPSQRAARLAAYGRQRDRVGAVLREVGRAFAFTLNGERSIGSRSAYVLAAVPRGDYSSSNADARALANLNGEIWIDRETFHWVKVTAGVQQAFSLFGVFVRLEPGTALEWERAPVEDGVWLTSRLVVRSQMKILSLLPHRKNMDARYYDYTKIPP
jgi:hypothetical protein